jgi:hypothetical protein
MGEVKGNGIEGVSFVENHYLKIVDDLDKNLRTFKLLLLGVLRS